MGGFNIADYSTVAERVKEFHTEFPEGNIQTYIALKEGPEVIIEARVFRTRRDVIDNVYTSGFAQEIMGKGNIQKVNHVEVAETSAVGRALANLCYLTDANRPSREEMLKAARQEALHEKYLEFVRTYYPKVSDELKEVIETLGVDAKDQITVAYNLVQKVEAELKIEFS